MTDHESCVPAASGTIRRSAARFRSPMCPCNAHFFRGSKLGGGVKRKSVFIGEARAGQLGYRIAGRLL